MLSLTGFSFFLLTGVSAGDGDVTVVDEDDDDDVAFLLVVTDDGVVRLGADVLLLFGAGGLAV